MKITLTKVLTVVIVGAVLSAQAATLMGPKIINPILLGTCTGSACGSGASGAAAAGTLTGAVLASGVTSAPGLTSTAGGTLRALAFVNPGSGVAAAAASGVNTAGGLLAADSTGKLYEANLPTSVMAASAPTAASQVAVSTGIDTIGFATLDPSIRLTGSGASMVLAATGGTGIVAGSTLTAGNMLKAGGAGSAVPATRGIDYAAPSSISTNIAGYIMPTATISDVAGTVTLGTALPETYNVGAWMYIGANQLKASIAAAWHWVVMSSTTLGQVCTETYDPTIELPYVPASCTAFADTVPGTITGYTAGEVTWVQITKPTNALGKNGSIKVDALLRNNNSSSFKTYRLSYGGTSVVGVTASTTTATGIQYRLNNRGITTKLGGYYATYGGSATPITAITVDDASSQNIAYSLGIAAASNVAGVQSLEMSFSKAPE